MNPTHRVRILLAVHHYPPTRIGGAELLTQRMARWLLQHDFDVRVVCIENTTRGDNKLRWHDDTYQEIPVRRLTLPLGRNSERLEFNNPALREHCETSIQEWKPDLVHLISGYLLGAAPLDAARVRNVPTIVTLTDFWFLCPTIQLVRGDGSLCNGPEPIECARCLYDDQRALRAADRRAPQFVDAFWRTAGAKPFLGNLFGVDARLKTLQTRHSTLIDALNQSNAIIALTRFVAEMHIANGVNADKIIVKPDCLDLRDFDSFTPRTAANDRVRFCYLGQITPLKGVDILIRAFRELEGKTLPAKQPTLEIHGKMNAEPSYARHLQQLAAGSKNIKFLGAYEHRRALEILNENDVTIVPSVWYENSPRVILESFAAKRPVIGTRVGGIAEVVQDEVNGLLFERGNAKDLARVMQRVIDEPALLPLLREKIPEQRSLDEDMRDVLSIYERISGMHVTA